MTTGLAKSHDGTEKVKRGGVQSRAKQDKTGKSQAVRGLEGACVSPLRGDPGVGDVGGGRGGGTNKIK